MFREAMTVVAGFISLCLVNSAAAQKVYIDTPVTIDYNVTDSQGQNAYAVIGSVNATPFNVNIVDGGSLLRGGEVDNQATLNISGGTAVNIGGAGGMLYAYGASRLNISGGTFVSTLELNDNSTATITNGSFQRGLLTQYSSTADIWGGFFTGSDYWSVSTGGGGTQTVNIYGGSFLASDGIFAASQSIINVYGTNLVLSDTGNNLPTGPSVGVLTGILEDGTPIDQNVSGARQSIVIHNLASVPEQSCMFTVIIGLTPVAMIGIRRYRTGKCHCM